MGAEENKNEILSRIVAELFAKSKGDEELSSKIQRLRGEIKKVFESDDTLFGKFRGLVESFREVIPEEQQRYHAALKALSTTAKVSRQEIVQAVNDQLAEIKILEKGLLGTASGRRDELTAMEDKAREMRAEISKLRDIIGRLENEEKEILNSIATWEKDRELISKAVGGLFTDIAAEVTSIKKKVEEFTAEGAAPQPIPSSEPLKSDAPSEELGGGEQENESAGSSAPPDTEFQKKCPMCGGRMDLYAHDKVWRCYSCGHEEVKEEKGEQKSDSPESSEPQDTEFKKKCPMCGGQMDFYTHENMWRCYSCAYEESKEGEVQDKSEETIEETIEEKSEDADAFKPMPASESIYDQDIPTLSSREFRGKGSIPGSIQDPIQKPILGSITRKKPLTKKKTCPSCRKMMNWVEEEGSWRCPFCEYERKGFN